MDTADPTISLVEADENARATPSIDTDVPGPAQGGGGAVQPQRYDLKEDDAAAVRILATDYGPGGFDGLPFSAWPDWLRVAACEIGSVRPVTPGSTDYAEWEVDTEGGCYLATPGDWLALAPGGRLMVLREITGPLHTPRKPMEPC